MLAFGGGSLQAQVSGSIEVYPANSTVEVKGSKQFSAYVPISPNTITWSVNAVVGGSAEFGTISASGLYQAPAVAPANSVLTIKAQSTAYPSSFKPTTLAKWLGVTDADLPLIFPNLYGNLGLFGTADLGFMA